MLQYVVMPNANRHYAIRVESTAIKVVNSLLFGYVEFTGRPWQLECTLTGESITLPKRMYINMWHVYKLREMLADTTCRIEPVFVHSCEEIRRQATSVDEIRRGGIQPPRYGNDYV